jgi:hypothetical protein
VALFLLEKLSVSCKSFCKETMITKVIRSGQQLPYMTNYDFLYDIAKATLFEAHPRANHHITKQRERNTKASDGNG